MNDRPMGRGWGLIGDSPSRPGARWPGLAARVKVLREYGDPEALERAGEALEATSDPLLQKTAEYVRGRALDARHALNLIESVGYEFDFERRVLTIPTGEPGRRPHLASEAVGAAFEELGGRAGYDRETLAAIRKRLSDLFASEELTDAKIKRRLQGYLKRRSRRREPPVP